MSPTVYDTARRSKIIFYCLLGFALAFLIVVTYITGKNIDRLAATISAHNKFFTSLPDSVTTESVGLNRQFQVTKLPSIDLELARLSKDFEPQNKSIGFPRFKFVWLTSRVLDFNQHYLPDDVITLQIGDKIFKSEAKDLTGKHGLAGFDKEIDFRIVNGIPYFSMPVRLPTGHVVGGLMNNRIFIADSIIQLGIDSKRIEFVLDPLVLFSIEYSDNRYKVTGVLNRSDSLAYALPTRIRVVPWDYSKKNMGLMIAMNETAPKFRYAGTIGSVERLTYQKPF